MGSTIRIPVTRYIYCREGGVDNDVVTGIELIQFAEKFTENIIMGRKHEVAGLTGIGGADVLSDAPF